MLNEASETKRILVRTARCLIREFTANDIPAFMAYRNNEQWMQYQDFKGLDQAVYSRRLLIPLDFRQGVQLAIADAAGNQLMGDLYLRISNRDCYLGYTIAPAFSRQGYAQETIRGIMPWLKQQGVTRILAEIHPDNQASISLVQKLEFREIKLIDSDYRFFERLID